MPYRIKIGDVINWIIAAFVFIFMIFVLITGFMINDLAISIAGGVAASFSLVYILYSITKKFKFDSAYVKLVEEMNKNKNNLCGFHDELNKFKIQLKNKDTKEFWLPKYAGFASWSPYVYHYFSLNAFQYFINQEFISDGRISKEQVGYLMEFYADCVNFNNETQRIENELNENRMKLLDDDEKLNKFVEEGCLKIDMVYKKYNMKIMCNFERFFGKDK